jgi:hypothetical protein
MVCRWGFGKNRSLLVWILSSKTCHFSWDRTRYIQRSSLERYHYANILRSHHLNFNNFEGLSGHFTSHLIGGVFSPNVRKREDWNVLKYNIVCSFVWIWNLSLTLTEEHRLRVSANRVRRRIWGSKTDDIVRGWIKLHDELCSALNVIRIIKSRRMTWAGHVACMERRGTHAGKVFPGLN